MRSVADTVSDAHLGKPELTAGRIATEHHTSLRNLYNVWPRTGHDWPIAQWITARRLQLGREKLATSGTQTIAAIARQCGFTDASQFSRRSRQSFGVPAQEWRAINSPDRVGCGYAGRARQ